LGRKELVVHEATRRETSLGPEEHWVKFTRRLEPILWEKILEKIITNTYKHSKHMVKIKISYPYV
jgi:hypothetical protein